MLHAQHIKYRLENRTGCQTPNCKCKCECCYFRLRKVYFVWSSRNVEAFHVLHCSMHEWYVMLY